MLLLSSAILLSGCSVADNLVQQWEMNNTTKKIREGLLSKQGNELFEKHILGGKYPSKEEFKSSLRLNSLLLSQVNELISLNEGYNQQIKSVETLRKDSEHTHSQLTPLKQQIAEKKDYIAKLKQLHLDHFAVEDSCTTGLCVISQPVYMHNSVASRQDYKNRLIRQHQRELVELEEGYKNALHKQNSLQTHLNRSKTVADLESERNSLSARADLLCHTILKGNRENKGYSYYNERLKEWVNVEFANFSPMLCLYHILEL